MLEKEEQIKLRVSWKKEIEKIRKGISKIENKQLRKKAKNMFFAKINLVNL